MKPIPLLSTLTSAKCKLLFHLMKYGETSKLARKRKEKCKAFKVFSAEPTMNNYFLLLKKQEELESANFQAKTKHDKMITENLKTNSKPFFSYIRSKSKAKSTVCAVKDNRNNLTTCSAETANVLAEYFESLCSTQKRTALCGKETLKI